MERNLIVGGTLIGSNFYELRGTSLPYYGHALQNNNDLYLQYMQALEKYLAIYLPVG